MRIKVTKIGDVEVCRKLELNVATVLTHYGDTIFRDIM